MSELDPDKAPESSTNESARSSEELLAEFLEVHSDLTPAEVEERASENVELRRLLKVHRAVGLALPSRQDGDRRGLHLLPRRVSVPAQSGFRVKPGMTIGGFELVRILGRGGMGEIWEATEEALSRRVALKLLLPERVHAAGLDFFAREARAGGRLSHPGIVAVHSAGEDEGLHWIAMELVEDACDLRQVLQGMQKEDELPDHHYEQTASLIAETAEALEVAHAAGVIHRDLKPANILITPDDHPKVLDFGLAKLIDENSISLSGDLVGTYMYMSPEQVAAKRMGLDHRTDVFSLGVILYELLTLTRPFQGDTTEQVAHKILMVDPPSPEVVRSKAPRDLAVICGKALQKDPDHRYPSMAEFAADLRRYANGEPILAQPSNALERAWKWSRRNPAKSLALSTTAASLLLITWLAVITAQSASALSSKNAELELARKQEQTLLKMTSTMMAPAAHALASQFSSDMEASIERTLEDANSTPEELEARLSVFRDLTQLIDFPVVARDVLEQSFVSRVSEKIKEIAEDNPKTEAMLRELIASWYYHPMGLYAQAELEQERVVALRSEHLGEAHLDTLESSARLAKYLLVQSKLDEAEPIFHLALESLRNEFGDDHQATSSCLHDRALLLQRQGKLEEAERDMWTTLEWSTDRVGAEAHGTLNMRLNLTDLLCDRGEFKSAEGTAREVLGANYESPLPDDPGFHALWLQTLGRALEGQGKLDEAVTRLREANRLLSLDLGHYHPMALTAKHLLAGALRSKQELEEAEQLLGEILSETRRDHGAAHPKTLELEEELESLRQERESSDLQEGIDR